LSQIHCHINTLDYSRFPLVDVYVSVMDSNGKPLLLHPADSSLFQTLINRHRIKVREITPVVDLKQKGDLELYLSLILDNSASMADRIGLLQEAVRHFIDSLGTGDYANIIDFGDELRSVKKVRIDNFDFTIPEESFVTIPEYPKPIHGRQKIDFTTSKIFLRKNLDIEDLTRYTYLYDAILLAASRANTTSILGRKAIIVFSDGVDFGSEVDQTDAMKYVQEYQIPVYSIDLNKTSNDVLKDMAERSGGEYFYVTRPEEIAPLYQSIYQLLKSQYRLTFLLPKEFVVQDTVRLSLSLIGRVVGSVSRSFTMKKADVDLVRLLYTESVGKQSLNAYVDYLLSYPRSTHEDLVRLKIGKYFQEKGEYAKALAVYNLLLRKSIGASHNQALIEKANLLMLGKKFAEAQQVYEEVLKNPEPSPIRAKALMNLADSYTEQGDFSKAFDLYSTLRGEYQGTELAADATFRSAAVRLEMGDLPAAAQLYTEVINNYSEWKYAVYARIELAKVHEKRNQPLDAIRLYTEVADAPTVDPDIRDEALRRLSELMISTGDYTNAIRHLQSIIALSSSPLSIAAAKADLVVVYNRNGQFQEAGKLYEELSQQDQEALQKKYPLLKISLNGVPVVALVNGAHVEVRDTSWVLPPIRIAEMPNVRTKFAIAGPMYAIDLSMVGSRVFLPVSSLWNMRPDESGIYYFVNGDWIRVPASIDPERGICSFVCAHDGIYALHTKPPVVTRLYDINFDLDKSAIRKGDEVHLYQIIDHLKANPDLRLEISGHTDSTGTEEHNILLSQQRATIVKEFLVQNGIARDRLEARGYASQLPLVSNATEENRQKNRRTEFTVLYSKSEGVQNNGREGAKFLVVLNSFKNPKPAVESKRVYCLHNFNVSLRTEENSQEGNYKLILGTFPTLEAAQKEVDRFLSDFADVTPTIVPIGR
jgi:VWFA-related protein